MWHVRHWRRWLTGAMIVAFVVAAVVHRDNLSRAAGHLADLSLGWILVLVGLYVASVVAQGAYARAITPQISLGQGMVVQHAATASNNTVIGGGPVSLGLRVAMLRSWGVPDAAIGLTVITLNLVAEYAVWLVSLGTAMIGLGGAAEGVVDRRIFIAVVVVAVAVLTGSTVLWWALLCRPQVTAWIARLAQRLFDSVRGRVRRLPSFDLVALADRSRSEARQLIRTRGWRILAASAADQLITIAKPIAVIRAFGIGEGTVSTAEIIVAYGLIRLTVALSPIPGGLGITEFGLAALLTRFGGPESSVLAAVLTYRAMTFVLPILSGGACLMAWRWNRRATGTIVASRSAEPVSQVDAMTNAVTAASR